MSQEGPIGTRCRFMSIAKSKSPISNWRMAVKHAPAGRALSSDGFHPTGLTPLILFGCLWAGFGIASFIVIGQWERAYNRKMALIRDGAVQPQTLYVTRIVHDRDEGNWGIGLNPRPGSSRSDEAYWATVTKLDGLAIGTPVMAYLIHGKWFVPRFSGGFSGGKWVFLAFGLVPPLLVATVALAVRAIRKRAAMRPAVAIGLAGGEQASSAALPRAFSIDRLHFDSRPTDEQLLALLGPPEYISLLQVDEDAARQTIRVRPGRLPVRWIMPWMVLVAAGITAAMWIGVGRDIAGNGRIAIWAMVAFIWLGVLPVMFGIFFAINSHFDKEPDYFEADFLHDSLSLPRAGVTVTASQIDCFTAVERWCLSNGQWQYVCQTGILARRQPSGFDHYLVFSDRAKRRNQWQMVDRLAEGFKKPVRRVTRTRSQSKLLPTGT